LYTTRVGCVLIALNVALRIYFSKLVFTVDGVCLVFAQMSGTARLALVMCRYWLWHQKALMYGCANAPNCWTLTVLLAIALPVS